jgi:hypothetical protein
VYGCESWSVILREEHRLRVFENRFMKLFGRKRDEVTGEWRSLQNEELHKYYSVDQVKKNGMVGHVIRVG